jgi:LuxR family transcriptional regulator, maltose regulon positive regulatory protein
LILILGQAAQGKSTLAASYIAVTDVPSAWVNLEKEDGDPVNLFYSLVFAFQHILKQVDFSRLLSYPTVNVGLREETPLYRGWVTALVQVIPGPVQLVLDGVDCLAQDAPSLQLLKILVWQLPPGVRLIMLSRTEPSLELQSLRVKQMARVISNQDLAFSLDETQAFFKELKKIPLSDAQIRKIHQFTEGWVGGLVLLSERLRQLQADHREKFIQKEIPTRFKGELFRYFGEEIFASQPDSAKQFLIRSSILDTIEPAFIRDFLGAEIAEKTLPNIVKKNLFVESIYDEKKGWIFRFHQLFRDFLHTGFMTEITPELRQSLLLKAGSLCGERGEHESSIKYYLEAKAYDRAIRVIEQIGMDLWRAGRTGDLSKWLRALPAELMENNPWLLYLLSLTRRFTEAKENASRLWKALKLFEQSGDTKGQMLSLAFLIEASTLMGNDVVPLPVLIEKGENLIQTSADQLAPYETALLCFQIGFASTVRGGNPRKGLWACEKANLLAIKAGDLSLQINALIHALGSLTYLGEYASTDEVIRRIENLLPRCPYPEFTSLYLINLSWLKMFRGNFAVAEELIQKSRNELEQNGLIYLYPYTWIYELLLKPQTGKYLEAEEIAGRLLSLSSALNNLFLEGVTYLLLGMSFYRKGDYSQARKLLERSERFLSSEKSSSLHHLNACRIMLNILAFHGSEDANGENNLRQVLAHSYEFSVYAHIVEAHLTLALLKAKQKKDAEAVEHLEKGFIQAREQGYYFYRFLSLDDLAKACLVAVKQEVNEAAYCYAEHLLSKQIATSASPKIEKLMHSHHAAVRKRAREIRKKMHLSTRPRLKIRTLGDFQVVRGGILMGAKDWRGTQPELLLKAIISHGSRGVPIELLADDLWPEGLIDVGAKRFKLVLHRLRASLEPDMDKRFRSSYLIQKGNRLYLDTEICEVDSEKFESLLKEGEIKERDGDMKSALLSYEEALVFYQGDFLAEERYAEWAQVRRKELTNKFVSLLLRMARIYEDRGSFAKAARLYEKSIRSDPTLEAAYQKLMALYTHMGKRNEALKLYEKCRQALIDLLDAEPDSVTTSIYMKILESSETIR